MPNFPKKIIILSEAERGVVLGAGWWIVVPSWLVFPGGRVRVLDSPPQGDKSGE